MLNTIGLIIDMIGVGLLFFYEPPKESHGILLESAPSEEERERIFRLKRKMSRIGLGALVLGFALQIISNLL